MRQHSRDVFFHFSISAGRREAKNRYDTFVPQSYSWGAEAQVDWSEAYAVLAGERTKLQVFSMRSMASGAAFHCAFLHATQQAFLEAHELAFAYFSGVFRKLVYDNLTSAVKKILRADVSGNRQGGSLRFARIGGLKASSAIRRKRMRKAGSKERWATFEGITGCRYRRRKIWRR